VSLSAHPHHITDQVSAVNLTPGAIFIVDRISYSMGLDCAILYFISVSYNFNNLTS
jgi:uncharacterized protein (DUF169 family)